MKKVLSLILVLAMLVSACVTALVIVSAESADAFTIDGALDDNGWSDADWVTDGAWQSAGYAVEDVTASYAIRADEENLYLAVKYEDTPVVSETFDASAFNQDRSTDIRIWIIGDGMEARTYYDILWDGEKFNAYREKVLTEELVYAYTTDGRIVLEVKIAKATLNVTDSVSLWISCSNPDYVKEDGTLGYNAYHITEVEGISDGSLTNSWWGNTSMMMTFACADIAVGATDTPVSGGAIAWSEESTVVSATTNIAEGKTWTGDTDKNVSTYAGGLTDGIIGPSSLKYDGSDPWFGWDKRLLAEDGIATAVIDLGETVTDISGIGAHVWLANGSGIMAPEKIVYSASLDGETYEVVGEITAFGDSGVAWENVMFDKYLSARYIKYEFTCVGTFTFVSELAVYTPKTVRLDYAGYKHAAAISLVAGGGQTVAEITTRGKGEAKDMNYAYLVIVDRDGKVIATNTGLQIGKSDVVCPEGGYIISYNCNVEGYDVVKEIKVGATVTLHNVSKSDMAFARTQNGTLELKDAYFTWDNSTALGEIAISHVNAYTWGVFNEMIVYGEGTNCHTIGYDCLYWIALKVENVDGVYTVTAIEGNGETKSMTAPADGFLVYCFGNDVESYAAASKVEVGDVLLVKTVDWTANVASETAVGSLIFGKADALDAVTPAADIDGDGELTAADSTAMIQYLAGLTELSEGVSEDDPDLDGNGSVDIYDSILLQQYLAGMIVEFPAE